MFPNVPEEHRALLEPTIREQIQPYITRLEQQLAPFRAFEGVDPQDAAGLLQMAQDFERDPVDVWLKMGQALFQNGQHLQDVDMDVLGQLARGEFPDEEPQAGNGNGQLPPELAQYLQPLQQQIGELTQWQQDQLAREQERQRQQMEQRQNQAFTQAVAKVKTDVVASGYPEELLTDEAIRAAIITANGQVDAAVQHFVNMRTGLLKGFVDQRQPQGQKPNVANGGPPRPPEPRQRRGGSRNPTFDAARDGAEQFLKSRNQADAESEGSADVRR
jgi:hypothetical protein